MRGLALMGLNVEFLKEQENEVSIEELLLIQ